MTERDDLSARLRADHEAATPDVWLQVRRRVEAIGISHELLAQLEGPLSPRGRLRWELQLRLRGALSRKAV